MKQTTNELTNVTNKVSFLLENFPETRVDDFTLIKKFQEVFYKEFSFNDILSSHNDINFPSFETITRARRKIQALHHDLSKQEVVDLRDQQAKVFRGYALSM